MTDALTTATTALPSWYRVALAGGCADHAREALDRGDAPAARWWTALAALLEADSDRPAR